MDQQAQREAGRWGAEGWAVRLGKSGFNSVCRETEREREGKKRERETAFVTDRKQHSHHVFPSANSLSDQDQEGSGERRGMGVSR